MLIYCYYIVRPSKGLVDLCDTDEDLLYTVGQPIILRNPEGGCRPIWCAEDHRVRLKILYLGKLKKEYEIPFLENLPLSEDSFDRWWTLEPADEMFTYSELAANWTDDDARQLVPTTSSLVNESLMKGASSMIPSLEHVDRRYRVYWEDQVVGWFIEPEFEFPNAQGCWSSVITQKGKEFREKCVPGHSYDVVVEGPALYRARLEVDGEKATLEILSDPV